MNLESNFTRPETKVGIIGMLLELFNNTVCICSTQAAIIKIKRRN